MEMYPRRDPQFSESEARSLRNSVIVWTLIVDFLDFGNGLYSMDEITKKNSPRHLPALHCCGCICLSFSVCCLLLTMFNILEICVCSCRPSIDILSGLTVWFGDMPQALHNIRFSKGDLDPRTLFGWPHAAAVLTVSLVRVILLIVRQSTYHEDEQLTLRQILQMVGLVFNIIFSIIALLYSHSPG